MKNRLLCHIVLIPMLLLLASCGYHGNPQTEFETEQNLVNTLMPEQKEPEDETGQTSQSGIDATTTPVYSPTWTPIDNDKMPYQYGNMLKSVFGADVWDTSDSILMTKEKSGNIILYEYIKSSGKTEPFCKLATCSHQTDECPAGNAYENIDMRNGTLTVLRKRDNNEKWISELNDGTFEFLTGPVNGYLQGEDGYFYVITPDKSLARIERSSKKTEILVDEFDAMKPLIVEHWLYAVMGMNIVRVDLNDSAFPVETILSEEKAIGFPGYTYSTDGTYLYYNIVNDETTSLYRCDLDGKNPVLVLPECIYSVYLSFDEEYMYYNTYHREVADSQVNGAIYRFPLNLSGEPELLCDTGVSFPMVYTLPTSPDTLLIRANRNYYFLPKTGGNLTEIPFP